MKYLLDTNVWLWSLWQPERINAKTREQIGDLSHEVFLSAVTSWEIAIKAAAGKLTLPESPSTYIPRRMADQGLRPLPVSHRHALEVFTLFPFHRDPFDRLLVAQARVEDLIVVTADRILEKYSVQVLWAGK